MNARFVGITLLVTGGLTFTQYTLSGPVGFHPTIEKAAEENIKELYDVPEIYPLSDREIIAYTKRQETLAMNSITPSTIHYQANLRLHQVLLRNAVREGLPLSRLKQSNLAKLKLVEQIHAKGFLSTTLSTEPHLTDRFKEWCQDNEVEKFPGTASTLLQMLQVEQPSIRLALIERVSNDKSTEATTVLANRALYDSSSEVRNAATIALGERPVKQYLPYLMKGLRYPLPQVAENAANSLLQLKPEGIEKSLMELLDKPNPTMPFTLGKSKKLYVAELVRINHLRNCLLCHPPLEENIPNTGLISAGIPSLGKELPIGSYAKASERGLVRFDTIHLRQDFSVFMKVEGSKPWPSVQRFDFMVRVRLATLAEIDRMKENESKLDYPQRRAILRVLQGIARKSN